MTTDEENRESTPGSLPRQKSLPWQTGAPGPWRLQVYGGPPRGPLLWITRGMLVLALLSLGLFTVTRLLLIHWVFLVPASLGSLFLLGALYVLLEMRRPPVAVLELCPGELSYREGPAVRGDREPGEGILLSLSEVGLGESDASRFDLVRLDTGESFARVLRESVRDVSQFETIRRYLSIPPSLRPPIPPAGPPKKRLYRWFLLSWGLIVLLMILWALYENYAAPRSYEPFSNP